MDTNTELFLEYKGLLFSMAYNMLGSVDAAEDIVQDVFLKWMEAGGGSGQNRKAFVVRMVNNASINHLTTARAGREEKFRISVTESPSGPRPSFPINHARNFS